MKTAFIVGVRRFGVEYYLGVGFNHQTNLDVLGPHYEQCRFDYDYPCSWENVASLVSHVQTLTYMSNRHSANEAFDMITHDPQYKGNLSGVLRPADYLCARLPTRSTASNVVSGELASSSHTLSRGRADAFAFDFNGTCVSHGANPGLIGLELIQERFILGFGFFG